MAFVHVEHRRRKAEPAQHADAADAEHELLAQPVDAVATVERVGDGAGPVGVPLDLRVEEVELDPPDLCAPDADPNRHEVAVLVGELDDRRHRHERQRQPVAGEDAEAAGVDRQALVETELGREVRSEEVAGQLLLLPPRRALALIGEPLLHAAEPERVVRCESAPEIVVGELGQERRRVVTELCEALRREVREEGARARRPAEREVARDRGERPTHCGRAVDGIDGHLSGI